MRAPTWSQVIGRDTLGAHVDFPSPMGGYIWSGWWLNHQTNENYARQRSSTNLYNQSLLC